MHKVTKKDGWSLYNKISLAPMITPELIFLILFLKKYFTYFLDNKLSDLTFLIKYTYYITIIILLIIFIRSILNIKYLLKQKSERIFIGFMKYCVGLCLIDIFIAFAILYNEFNKFDEIVNNLLNQIVLLTTALFFFIDGISEINSKVQECECEIDLHIKEKYKRIKRKIELKRAISQLYSFYFVWWGIVYIAYILVCIGADKILSWIDVLTTSNDKVRMFVVIVVTILSIAIFAMVKKGIKADKALLFLFRSNNYMLEEDKLKALLKDEGLLEKKQKYIFKDIEINKEYNLNYSQKEEYYYKYIKVSTNEMINISDMCDENTNWYRILADRETVGYCFCINRNYNSYIFVRINYFKRKKGYGTLALAKLEKLLHQSNINVQLNDEYYNKDVVIAMLTENGYKLLR